MTTTVNKTDWHGWKITDEQATAIRNGDLNARNTFFFDNLDRIRSMAYNYGKRNSRCFGLVDDMINTVWVDLTVFKQSNGKPVIDGKSLSGFVYSSFRFCPMGGLDYLFENNPKVLGDIATYGEPVEMFSFDTPATAVFGRNADEVNGTLADIIPAPVGVYYVGDLTEKLKNVVADFLTPRENEYFKWFIEGYGNAEISHRMGYRGESNNGPRVKEKLRNNAQIILSRLSALGVNVDGYKGKTPYNPKTERTYKLSPEQRAKYAENMRRQRAKKKAIIFESTLSKIDNPAQCVSV